MSIDPLSSSVPSKKRLEKEDDCTFVSEEAEEKTRIVFTDKQPFLQIHPVTGLLIPKGLHRRARRVHLFLKKNNSKY